MPTPEPYLELLREYVRKKSSLSSVYHKECEVLSEEIQRTTGNTISSSTLKRFFRLVSSSSKPSSFTLDVLSQFAGFDHFDHFCSQAGKPGKHNKSGGESAETVPKDVTSPEFIDRLQEEIRCELDYSCICNDKQELLLHREFIINDMYRFLRNSGKRIYPLIAPGGYGKTVLMQLFYCDFKNRKPDNTLVIFTSASAIFEIVTSRTGLREVLKHFVPSLQYRPEALDHLLVTPDYKIVLMIDGLDEAGSDQSDVFAFFKGAVQLMQESCRYPEVSIIFSKRTESWLNCTGYMPGFRPDDYWYLRPGTFGSDEDSNTVPPLSVDESRKLWNKLNRKLSASARSEISEDVLSLTGIPYQLSLLHRITCRTNIDAVTSQDVFGTYIQHLMYDTPHSIGIRSLFREFIKACNYGASSARVDLSSLQDVISRHPGAWEELLGREIFLIEEYSGNGMYRRREVLFSHQKLFETAVAVEWYGEGIRSVRDLHELVDKLRDKTAGIGVMEQVAWAIMRNHRMDLLTGLFESSLTTADKVMLSRSMFDLWQSEEEWLEQYIDELAANQSIRWYYFENLTVTDDLPGFFGRALEAYERHSESVQDLLYANSLLAVRAFLAMDFKTFQAHIAYMDTLPKNEDIHLYPLIRYWSYRSLLHWLMGDDPGYSLSKVDELMGASRDESRFNTNHSRTSEKRDRRIPLYLHNPALWLMDRKEDIAMHYHDFQESEKEDLLQQSKRDIRMFTLLYFLFYSGVIPEPSLKTSEGHRLFITNGNLPEANINQCLRLLIMADWHLSKKQPDTACRYLSEVAAIAKNHHFVIFHKLAEYKIALTQEDARKRRIYEKEWAASGFGRIIGLNSAAIHS